ncbi:hypothetical protein [Massilia horti]|nr:hypothetical protein [Massilia horti]
MLKISAHQFFPLESKALSGHKTLAHNFVHKKCEKQLVDWVMVEGFAGCSKIGRAHQFRNKSSTCAPVSMLAHTVFHNLCEKQDDLSKKLANRQENRLGTVCLGIKAVEKPGLIKI